MKSHLQDVALATPTASVAGLTIYGIALSDWVYLLTAVYTILLISDKLHSMWVRKRTGKERNEQGK